MKVEAAVLQNSTATVKAFLPSEIKTMPLDARPINPIEPPARPMPPHSVSEVGLRPEKLINPVAFLPDARLAASQEWQIIGSMRNFQVAGLGWFRGRFMRSIDMMNTYRPQMEAIFDGRTDWSANSNGLDWPAKFNKRQLQEHTSSVDPKLLSFPKGLQVITLCEAILATEGYEDPQIVYDHMYLEPVVYYVVGLNSENWRVIKNLYGNKVVDELLAATHQNNPLLFENLASGFTCTYRTANAAQQVLANYDPQISGVSFSRLHRPNGRRSPYEMLNL